MIFALSRRALLTAAVSLLAGCGPLTLQHRPEPKPRLMVVETAVAIPDSQEAAACEKAASAAPSESVGHALRLWCGGEAQAESLRYLARLAYERGKRRFRPELQIAPNIRIVTETQADATYLLAEDYGVDGTPAIGVLPGLGMPLVRQRDNSDEHFPNYPPEGMYDAVAMVADPTLDADGGLLIRLYEETEPALHRRGYADASGQAYLQLLELVAASRQQIDREIRKGLANPAGMTGHPDGIYLIEPYDPGRIPVLLIHGLKSSPLIWRDLTLGILSDSDLHARYQVWHAFYPTGVPSFYTASRLRRALNELLDRNDPAGADMPRRHMAVIGHSMGGIIARILSTDAGSALWDITFTVPPEELAVDPAHLQTWKEIMMPRREPGIGFVGFINTPHRGSAIADGVIGRIGSALISIPSEFRQIFAGESEFEAQVTPDMAPYIARRGSSSVGALSPRHPMVQKLSELPLPEGATVVSVIGVKKGADCVVDPDCTATDGVVSYESAHVAGADELVVRSGHDSFRKPETLDFVLDHLRRWPPEAGD
ncbi:esterase/lipase family protein [Gimibacter soli]|uniref:Alpha/beta hydrolase n=1 Tax=Gimibacter soli TaxID=3024400 RepID=A0AAE9XSW1_9PROT|nr:alpha/beta hydrolase [Gimibacter soli]WCL54381.1 alpha/beta hydrolase [Gimibacter soli]